MRCTTLCDLHRPTPLTHPEGGEEGEEEDLEEEEEEEEEEDSLMGDFDDRCESDISGVATDDTDSDLSNMIYSIGDLPLTAGRRLYRHRPNSSLNSVLTIISMMALCLAIGIGVGHYLGKNSRDHICDPPPPNEA